jgi:hypothetical protein
VPDPRIDKLFDAIEIGKPTKLVIKGSKRLSQADWEKHPKKDVLLPHQPSPAHTAGSTQTPHLSPPK